MVSANLQVLTWCSRVGFLWSVCKIAYEGTQMFQFTKIVVFPHGHLMSR